MFLLLRNKKFLRATAVLIGTMVGAGVFSIPFAFSKAGFFIGVLSLVFVTMITLLIDLIYAEIILRTSERHQIVGYMDKYLGKGAKKIVSFAVILSAYGALLAYIIISGEFFLNVLNRWLYVSSEALSTSFFIIASIIVLVGVRTVSWVELGLSALFIVIVGTIAYFGFSGIDPANFTYSNIEFWFLPYGIFLFAFAGLAGIPIQRRILAGQERLLSLSIICAVTFVFILYAIFGLTVFGLTGDITSPEAINGLVGFVDENVILLTSLFGAMAISTSYLMLGSSLSEIFRLDYKMNHFVSWVLVVLPPFILFLSGMRNFIDVISLSGSVAIGLEAAMLAFAFPIARKIGDRNSELNLKIPAIIAYLVGLMFVIGAAYDLIKNNV